MQDLTCAMEHLPVPCMAEELERQCQRLDSLLEDEEYYATEDADTYVGVVVEVVVEERLTHTPFPPQHTHIPLLPCRFFEPLFERIASIRAEEDTTPAVVGAKRPAMVVMEERTNSSCDHNTPSVATDTADHTPATTTAMKQKTLAPAAAKASSTNVTTKFTLPRKPKIPSSRKGTPNTNHADAVRANYEHYMTTGQALAPGNWRGCMKSRECDRESRHRGICNHKCVVPAPTGVCVDAPSPRGEGSSHAPPLKRVRVAGSSAVGGGRKGPGSTSSADDSDGDTMTPGTSHTNALGTWRDEAEVTMPTAAAAAVIVADDDVSIGGTYSGHDAAADEPDAATTTNHNAAPAGTPVSLDEPFACFPTVREPWPQHRARLEALGLHHGVDLKSHLRKRFPSLATGFDPNDVGIVGQRQCTACSKQVTPVWRAGPTGPKSLCNACGVRHLKNFKRK